MNHGVTVRLVNPLAASVLEEYLRTNLYDGLYTDEFDGCGCSVDDLMPCGAMSPHCRLGYRVTCTCGLHDDFFSSERRECTEDDSY